VRSNPITRGVLGAGCALAIAACGSSQTATVTRAGGSGSGQTGAAAPAAATAAAGPATVTSTWTQFGDNPQRSGVGPQRTGITAGDLGELRLREVRIPGIADSAAVERPGVRIGGRAHDLVAVTTSYGTTVAFDARTGQRLWQFTPRHVNSTPGNPQVTTATPIIDPDGRFLYTASPNGIIHKLSLTTGRPVWSRSITLDAGHEKIASALNLSGPWVIAVTGGYIGDAPPYDGHVVTLARGTGRIVHVWNTECSNRSGLIRASSCGVTNTRGDNAIWGRAGAIVVPGSGRILVATGNGPFDGRLNWGNSVLELAPDASRLLHNWTPTNEFGLDHSDTDIGSSAPALLGRFGHYAPLVQGAKDGELHLLDLNRLNGTTGPASGRLGGELSETAAPGHAQVFTQPAVWHSGGQTYVFVADNSGTAGYVLRDQAHPRLVPVWSDGSAGTSPVLAGGLLYVYDPGGAIRIRQPTSGRVLRTLPAGGGHWNSPIVLNGHIIEPTGAYGSSATSTVVDVYHLPGH
jgi:outer membrane protein assembly factor BamB